MRMIIYFSGDNYDKIIKAVHAGLLSQDKNLHMFHCFAKLLEVLPDGAAKTIPRIPINELRPSDILANQEHFELLKAMFVVIILRIATKRIPQLERYAKYVTKHIEHKYSHILRHASVTVCAIKNSYNFV